VRSSSGSCEDRGSGHQGLLLQELDGPIGHNDPQTASMITVLPKAENGSRHDANRTRAQFDCGGALSEITAIANKMRQGRSNASASGNQLNDAGSSLMIWRGVVEARMLSDTEAIFLASAILGVAWLALM
jgi:hypothetical protein